MPLTSEVNALANCSTKIFAACVGCTSRAYNILVFVSSSSAISVLCMDRSFFGNISKTIRLKITLRLIKVNHCSHFTHPMEK